MSEDVRKSDCIPVVTVLKELGIVRNTLNGYLNALRISPRKFPFDRKSYITNSEYEQLKIFISEL